MKTMRIVQVCVIAFVALALTSCQSSQIAQTLEQPAQPIEPSDTEAASAASSAELAYELARQKWCSNDRAFSLVLHMVDGQDTCGSFQERLELLKDKNLLRADWQFAGDEAVTKGTLGYLVCRALKIKGGLLLQLVPSKRYAYREAVYQELIHRGSGYEPLTGPEVVGIMGRAARMARNQPDAQQP